MPHRWLLTLAFLLAGFPAFAADTKVSDETAATTPLAGTELLYCVQGGADRKCTAISIANLVLASPTFTGTVTLPNTVIGAGAAITSSGAGGALGTNAFTSTAYAPLASPTFTGTVTMPDASTFATNFTVGGNAILTGPSAAKLQFGAANVNGAPVAQTLSFQGALAGSATNTASANTTIVGSLGTGTGTNGDIIVQSGLKTTTGTAQATPTTALTIKGETQQVQINNNSGATSTSTSGALNVTGGIYSGGTNYFLGTANFGDASFLSSNGAAVFSGGRYAFTSGNANGTADTFLTRKAAANMQFGAADAAAPLAQTISFQSVVAGTADTAGVATTIKGSTSTGSGAAGDIIFQTGATGAASTAQNTYTTGLTIKGATQLVLLPAIASDATHTDSTVCQDTTTHALYAGSGAAGICLGTSSIRFKNRVTDLPDMGDALLALRPVRYYLNEDHGGSPTKPLYGFIAEDAAPVTPELVGRDAEDRPNTFDLVGVVPMLVQTVQRQQKRIEELERQERQFAGQEKRLAELERRLAPTATAIRADNLPCWKNPGGCVIPLMENNHLMDWMPLDGFTPHGNAVYAR